MDKATGSFFQQLRKLAEFVDRGVIECKTKFEEKNREFCAPGVLTSMSTVKKEVRTLEEKVDEELVRSRNVGCTIDQIIEYGKLFLEKQNEKISIAETYLQKYGFQVKEFDENSSHTRKNEELDEVTTIASVQSTPADFSQNKSRLNKTPELEHALSKVTLENLRTRDKNIGRGLKKQTDHVEPMVSEEEAENVKDSSDVEVEREDRGQEKEQEVTANLTSEDLQCNAERSDKTFCIKPDRPVTPPSVSFNQPTKINRTPQLEDAGLSKRMMDRLAALEKQQIQVPREIRRQPTLQQQVPACFQHDGIICTPSLFGGKMDRSGLNLREALASPVHQSFSVQKHEGDTEIFESSRVSKQLNLTSTDPESYMTSTKYNLGSKENITPTEPELLTQGINRGKCDRSMKEDEKQWKKLIMGDMPKSPKLHGNYAFSSK